MSAACQLLGTWKMPEVHNTEDILSRAAGSVGIFPFPYSKCAYFTIEESWYMGWFFFILGVFF